MFYSGSFDILNDPVLKTPLFYTIYTTLNLKINKGNDGNSDILDNSIDKLKNINEILKML